MDKNDLKARIRQIVKDKMGSNTLSPEGEAPQDTFTSKFEVVLKFPTLHGILEDLFNMQYETFIEDVEYTAPRPTTFRIVLKNGAHFYLIYSAGPNEDHGTFIAEISGKRYFLKATSEEQQACDALARLLRHNVAAPNKAEVAGGDDLETMVDDMESSEPTDEPETDETE